MTYQPSPQTDYRTIRASYPPACGAAGRAGHKSSPDRAPESRTAMGALFGDQTRRGSGVRSGPVDPLGSRPVAPAGSDALEQATAEQLGTRARTPVNALLTGTRHQPACDGGEESERENESAPQLTRTQHGTVLYGGVPTKLSDSGARQVFYGSDWVAIDEFERMGLTPADSALSVGTVTRIGTKEQRERLNEGPSSPLGVI